MASNRDVLHWNLESKPFRGRSYLSFILERWCHLFTQFMHAIKKPNDSFHKLVTKQGQCICTRNAKHSNLAATFSKRWKNIGMWYIFKRKVFCLPKPGTDVIPFHLGVIFFNSEGCDYLLTRLRKSLVISEEHPRKYTYPPEHWVRAINGQIVVDHRVITILKL